MKYLIKKKNFRKIKLDQKHDLDQLFEKTKNSEKWQLQTKSTCYSIKEQKKRIKRLDATELRRSSRLASKQHNL